MNGSRFPVRAAAAGLILSLLACRPVFAIGWGELVILFLVIAFLLGPFLMKFMRAWNEFQETKKKNRINDILPRLPPLPIPPHRTRHRAEPRLSGPPPQRIWLPYAARTGRHARRQSGGRPERGLHRGGGQHPFVSLETIGQVIAAIFLARGFQFFCHRWEIE